MTSEEKDMVSSQSNARFNSESDCSVCLQPRVHPTQLPCGHIFCFLCLKGIAFRSRKCALCRQEIPADYLNHPIFIEPVVDNTISASEGETSQWFYEGRNGWWKYEQRCNDELEEKWQSGATRCQLQVAGAVYDIDFINMLQYRHNDVFRRRKIKRDHPNVPTKGIAGIFIAPALNVEPSNSSSSAAQIETKSDPHEEAIFDMGEAFALLYLESHQGNERSASEENDATRNT